MTKDAFVNWRRIQFLKAPLLAYQMIEIVDRLGIAARQLIEPIAANSDYPEIIKSQARLLLERVDILTDQTGDCPDLDRLYIGLTELRFDVERFIRSLTLKID